MAEPDRARAPQGPRRRHPVPPVPLHRAGRPAGVRPGDVPRACPCTRTPSGPTSAGSRRRAWSPARSARPPAVGGPRRCIRSRAAEGEPPASTGCWPRCCAGWSGASGHSSRPTSWPASGAPTSSAQGRPKPGVRPPAGPNLAVLQEAMAEAGFDPRFRRRGEAVEVTLRTARSGTSPTTPRAGVHAAPRPDRRHARRPSSRRSTIQFQPSSSERSAGSRRMTALG